MIEAWRVVNSRYARTAFDGEGARRAGGRFNSRGTAVVYAAESLAVAMLETLVHLPSYERLFDRVALSARFHERLVEKLEESSLPDDWNAAPPPRRVQAIGDRWHAERRSLVLRVPSVLVPGAFNYVINPEHASFHEIQIGPPVPLAIDPRLIAGTR